VALAILGGVYLSARVKASTLNGGDFFSSPMYSDNGQYYLSYSICAACLPGGASSFLVAFTSGSTPYWTSLSDGACSPIYGYHVAQTVRAGPESTIMQYDGNFVLYNTGSPTYAAWATNTDGHSGAYLSLQNDGNLVIYTASGAPIWALTCS
jgi:hypothetical protein